MRSFCVMMLLATPAMAQDWVPVESDAAITQTLAGRTVFFDPYTYQVFGSDGETQFVTERASNGIWTARDGQYCAQWPPSSRWDCYDIALRADEIKFIAYNAAESVGILSK